MTTLSRAAEIFREIATKNGCDVEAEIEKSPTSNSIYLWMHSRRGLRQVRLSDHELPANRIAGRFPKWDFVVGENFSEDEFRAELAETFE